MINSATGDHCWIAFIWMATLSNSIHRVKRLNHLLVKYNKQHYRKVLLGNFHLSNKIPRPMAGDQGIAHAQHFTTVNFKMIATSSMHKWWSQRRQITPAKAVRCRRLNHFSFLNFSLFKLTSLPRFHMGVGDGGGGGGKAVSLMGKEPILGGWTSPTNISYCPWHAL